MIEEDYYEEDYAPDYDWREEEWDALTDGQYGDTCKLPWHNVT